MGSSTMTASPTATTSRATAATASISATNPMAASASVAAPTTNVSRALQRLPSVSSASYLPSQIWNVPWVPTVGRYVGLFSPELLAESVYDVATHGSSLPKLEIRGKDVADLVISFKELLRQAAAQGDFTEVLSPDRSFLM
jgi:hypothetical protein